MVEVPKESGLFFIALVIGISTLRKFNLFYKLVLLQIFVFAIVYIGGYAITYYQEEHHLIKNNTWIYNLYFPIECALLTGAGLFYFKSKRVNFFAFITYALFSMTLFFQLNKNGINSLANFAVAIEALLLVTIYLFILYDKLKDSNFNWKVSPEFWLCIGIVLYFGCIVPYFSMINYLNATNPQLSFTLFVFINDVLSNIRYLLTAFAFWLFYRQQTIVPTNMR